MTNISRQILHYKVK